MTSPSPASVGSITRSSYYDGKDESLFNVQLLRRIDEQFLETPFYGSRQMTRWLRPGDMGHRRVRRLAALDLQAIFQRTPDVSAAPGAPDTHWPRPGDHAGRSGSTSDSNRCRRWSGSSTTFDARTLIATERSSRVSLAR